MNVGRIDTSVTIENATDASQALRCDALVDTRASFMVLPSAWRNRRDKPSHGYRAVHAVVKIAGKLVEIQVRTELQHLWAEQSEKFSDVVDPHIKYGGGNPNIQRLLGTTSEVIAEEELFELDLARHQTDLSKHLAQVTLNPALEERVTKLQAEMQERQERIIAIRQRIAATLKQTLDKLPRKK